MKTHLGERIPLTLNRMKKFLLNLGSAVALPAIFMLWLAVSYTHLTLPTNREV